MPDLPYIYFRLGGEFQLWPQLNSTRFKQKFKDKIGYELHWL